MAATALGNIPLSCGVYKDTEIDAALSGLASGVAEQIASAVSTAWKAGGSKAPTDLTSALLVAANEGKVYNMSASGTTDTNFIEGSGKPYTAGTDIAVIDVGTGGTHTYKFNVLAATDSSVVKQIYLGSSDGTALTPTNGSVTIPFASSSEDGILSSGDYETIFGQCGISGAVNDLSESVGTLSGNVDSLSSNVESLSGNVDSLSGAIYGDQSGSGGGLSGAVEELQCGMSVCVTGITIDGTTYSGGGDVDITSEVYASVSTDSGTVDATNGNVIDMHGSGGISVYASGDSVIVDGGTVSGVASGAASGVTALSGVVSGLKNFSGVEVYTTSGSSTSVTVSAGSNSDKLKLVAGDNVTLSGNATQKTITINATVPSVSYPVTDGKISGGSSLLSGTTIVIPVASTSAKGVTQLTDSVSNSTTTAITPNAVSGAISGVNSGLATKVSGGSLHTALSGSGLANGAGSTNNTIYALINALHSVDGQNEGGSAVL